MNIAVLLKTHRVALTTKEVWVLMKKESELPRIYVRNIFFDQIFQLIDYAKGPFYFKDTPLGGEIGGYERKTSTLASFRILKDDKNTGSVEIKNKQNINCFRPAIDGVRIYIPFD